MAKKSSSEATVLIMLFFLSLMFFILSTLSEPHAVDIGTLLN